MAEYSPLEVSVYVPLLYHSFIDSLITIITTIITIIIIILEWELVNFYFY